MNYELRTEYKLKPEVDTTHDISKGLRRHMPAMYDELGHYRERRWDMPWVLCVMIVVGGLVLAKIVL